MNEKRQINREKLTRYKRDEIEIPTGTERNRKQKADERGRARVEDVVTNEEGATGTRKV